MTLNLSLEDLSTSGPKNTSGSWVPASVASSGDWRMTTSETNKQVVNDSIQALFTKGHVSVADRLLAEEFVVGGCHGPKSGFVVAAEGSPFRIGRR